MLGDLLIDTYVTTLTPGCCPLRFYALVFNDQNQALKNTAGSWALAEYLEGSHSDFCIPLEEHAERTKYYSGTIEAADLSLPASAIGESYYVEIWYHDADDIAYDREVDTIHSLRRFRWSGTRFIESQLDVSGEDRLSQWLACVATAYDSEEQVVRFMAHLEKNGEFQSNPLTCNMVWRNRSGEELANVTLTDANFVPSEAGIFTWTQGTTDLDPDEVCVQVITITDANGIEHKTISYTQHWD